MNRAPEFTFGLVTPTEPGNVGAAARSLGAFGFKRLALIDPAPRQASRDRALAVKIGRAVLAEMQSVPAAEIESFLAGFDEIWGTSARAGRRRVHDRADALVDGLQRREVGRILILFGTERDGLGLDWLDRCHHLVRLPTPGGPLNLAQAVTVIAYEIASRFPPAEAADELYAPDAPATRGADEPEVTLGVRREILRRTQRLLGEIGFPTRALRSHPSRAYLAPLRTGRLPRGQARWLMGLLTRLEERLGLTDEEI